MMPIIIREFIISDYEAAFHLWQSCDGMGLSEADTYDNISRFLSRNSGFSFVAEQRGHLVGTILCGHDGRRGYIYHLATAHQSRKQGIGRLLVEKSLGKLAEEGILKCHIFAIASNESGVRFWKAIQWELREELVMLSHKTSHLKPQ